MKYLLHRTRIAALYRQRNGYLTLALGLLVMCCVLIGWILCHLNRERIVLVPAGFHQAAWVDASGVSAEYLSQMSLMLVHLRLNLTPETVSENRRLLLRYVDSAAWSTLRQLLVTEGDHLTRARMATAFYVTQMGVEAGALHKML